MSNCPKDHPSSIQADANKVIGMFKDEAGGKKITEFVGLRAKPCTYTLEGEDNKKCKQVTKTISNKGITFSDYKQCLET